MGKGGDEDVLKFIFFLLVAVLSVPMEGRRCTSESCLCVSADSFPFSSNDALISKPAGCLSLVVL